MSTTNGIAIRHTDSGRVMRCSESAFEHTHQRQGWERVTPPAPAAEPVPAEPVKKKTNRPKAKTKTGDES